MADIGVPKIPIQFNNVLYTTLYLVCGMQWMFTEP